MQFSDDPCGICICEVYVCPFKVHLILLYTQIRLLSTIILIIFVGATLLYKKCIDKSENEVYNVTIGYTGGFISIIQLDLGFTQGPPRDIVGRYLGILPRICSQKYSPLSGLQGFWKFQHNRIIIGKHRGRVACIPQCFSWCIADIFFFLTVPKNIAQRYPQS